ncbi:hypothetical protein BC834DRAFT_446557 [Gloeopeniophorella convolvens]|nr:hypothetical protein BC834DRAFT_446557 [Gloeopeniophorella convolvens]
MKIRVSGSAHRVCIRVPGGMPLEGVYAVAMGALSMSCPVTGVTVVTHARDQRMRPVPERKHPLVLEEMLPEEASAVVGLSMPCQEMAEMEAMRGRAQRTLLAQAPLPPPVLEGMPRAEASPVTGGSSTKRRGRRQCTIGSCVCLRSWSNGVFRLRRQRVWGIRDQRRKWCRKTSPSAASAASPWTLSLHRSRWKCLRR